MVTDDNDLDDDDADDDGDDDDGDDEMMIMTIIKVMSMLVLATMAIVGLLRRYKHYCRIWQHHRHHALQQRHDDASNVFYIQIESHSTPTHV